MTTNNHQPSVPTIISWNMDLGGAGVGLWRSGGISVMEGGKILSQRCPWYFSVETSMDIKSHLNYCIVLRIYSHHTDPQIWSLAPSPSDDSLSYQGSPCCTWILQLGCPPDHSYTRTVCCSLAWGHHSRCSHSPPCRCPPKQATITSW